jgi:XRE family transcriptional regulator, regulator of sulfur utilization
LKDTRTTVLAAVLGLLLGLTAQGADPKPQGSFVLPWEELQARPVNGKSRSIVRSPTATLDELESHVTVLPAGEASHAPHRHPQEEVIIVREGTVEFFQNGVTTRVGPGGFAFMASMDEHNAKNVGDTPATYFVINWKTPKSVAPKP